MKFNKRIIILCTCILMCLFAVAYEPFGPIDYSLPSDKTYSRMYDEDEQFILYGSNQCTVGGGSAIKCNCGMYLCPKHGTELEPRENGNVFYDTGREHHCNSHLNGEYVLLIFVFLLFLHRLLINKNVNVLNK